MARRRLVGFVVALILLTVAAGTASSLSSDSLPSDERLLVGTWRLGDETSWTKRLVFRPDRECLYEEWLAPHDGPRTLHCSITGRWSLPDGVIYLDHERNAVRRALRPLAWRIGIGILGQTAFITESVTADQIIIATPNPWTETYTRAPAD
jgi:hypothetical protein